MGIAKFLVRPLQHLLLVSEASAQTLKACGGPLLTTDTQPMTQIRIRDPSTHRKRAPDTVRELPSPRSLILLMGSGLLLLVLLPGSELAPPVQHLEDPTVQTHL